MWSHWTRPKKSSSNPINFPRTERPSLAVLRMLATIGRRLKCSKREGICCHRPRKNAHLHTTSRIRPEASLPTTPMSTTCNGIPLIKSIWSKAQEWVDIYAEPVLELWLFGEPANPPRKLHKHTIFRTPFLATTWTPRFVLFWQTWPVIVQKYSKGNWSSCLSHLGPPWNLKGSQPSVVRRVIN